VRRPARLSVVTRPDAPSHFLVERSMHEPIARHRLINVSQFHRPALNVRARFPTKNISTFAALTVRSKRGTQSGRRLNVRRSACPLPSLPRTSEGRRRTGTEFVKAFVPRRLACPSHQQGYRSRRCGFHGSGGLAVVSWSPCAGGATKPDRSSYKHTAPIQRAAPVQRVAAGLTPRSTPQCISTARPGRPKIHAATEYQ